MTTITCSRLQLVGCMGQVSWTYLEAPSLNGRCVVDVSKMARRKIAWLMLSMPASAGESKSIEGPIEVKKTLVMRL